MRQYYSYFSEGLFHATFRTAIHRRAIQENSYCGRYESVLCSNHWNHDSVDATCDVTACKIHVKFLIETPQATRYRLKLDWNSISFHLIFKRHPTFFIFMLPVAVEHSIDSSPMSFSCNCRKRTRMSFVHVCHCANHRGRALYKQELLAMSRESVNR